MNAWIKYDTEDKKATGMQALLLRILESIGLVNRL